MSLEGRWTLKFYPNSLMFGSLRLAERFGNWLAFNESMEKDAGES